MEGLLFLKSLYIPYYIVWAFENFLGADKSPRETMNLALRTTERTITESSRTTPTKHEDYSENK